MKFCGVIECRFLDGCKKCNINSSLNQSLCIHFSWSCCLHSPSELSSLLQQILNQSLYPYWLQNRQNVHVIKCGEINTKLKRPSKIKKKKSPNLNKLMAKLHQVNSICSIKAELKALGIGNDMFKVQLKNASSHICQQLFLHKKCLIINRRLPLS